MRFAILALRRRSGVVTRVGSTPNCRVSIPKNMATIRCHQLGGALSRPLESVVATTAGTIGTKSLARAAFSALIGISSNVVLREIKSCQTIQSSVDTSCAIEQSAHKHYKVRLFNGI
jgi:hypothetical protein